jgi:hypothetical protein
MTLQTKVGLSKHSSWNRGWSIWASTNVPQTPIAEKSHNPLVEPCLSVPIERTST